MVNSDVVVMEPVGGLCSRIPMGCENAADIGVQTQSFFCRELSTLKLNLVVVEIQGQLHHDVHRHELQKPSVQGHVETHANILFLIFASKIDLANDTPCALLLKITIIESINYLFAHGAIMRRNSHSVFFGLKTACQSKSNKVN